MNKLSFSWPDPIFAIKLLVIVMFFGFLRFIMFFPEGYGSSTLSEALTHPELFSSFVRDTYFYLALGLFIIIISISSAIPKGETNKKTPNK